MSSRQAIHRFLAASKVLLVWVAMLAYCASAIGVAIPLPATAKKDSGEAFPCQHHRCGCHSAEQCRRSCCCFSPEQKIAWARANGASDQAVVEGTATLASAGSKGKSCCHKGGHDPGSKGTKDDSTPWLHTISAAKCQGLATLWITIGVALPPSSDGFATTISQSSDTIPALACAWPATSFPPPVPPPRNI
jgi:hypothetical protein